MKNTVNLEEKLIESKRQYLNKIKNGSPEEELLSNVFLFENIGSNNLNWNNKHLD
jgi:hypothetical protein